MPEGLTIPALLTRRVHEDPDVQAVVSDEASITYAALDEESRRLAQRLVAAGVDKGDRVGLVLPNGIDWAVVSLAVMRIGAVLVPLSTLLRPPELVAQLHTASITHLVTVASYRGRSYLDELDQAAPGARTLGTLATRTPVVPSLRQVWAWDDIPAESVPAALVEALEARVHPADDLAVIFTSGSRGAPKGVIHTHGSALRATAAGLDSRQVHRGERLYIPMPLFWVGGFGTGLLSALLAGATLLTEATPEPARTLRFLERERVTLFRGWPDQAAGIAADPAFAAADLSSLRPASLSGVLSPGRRPAPGARANLFGMTESFGPYCGARLDLDLPPDKHGSCGRPFPGVEVRVVDTESRAAVKPGERGEILLRGPHMMRGICGRLQSELFDADGWYATGDARCPRRRRLPVVHRPGRRPVQGEGRHRGADGGRSVAAEHSRRPPGLRDRRGGCRGPGGGGRSGRRGRRDRLGRGLRWGSGAAERLQSADPLGPHGRSRRGPHADNGQGRQARTAAPGH